MNQRRVSLLFLTLCGAITVATIAWAQSEIRLEEPVENFRVPKFNEEGYREWHLKAAQGTYINNNEVLINDMFIRQFAGDGSSEAIATLETAQATYYIDSSMIAGPGEILAQSEQFKLTGLDWVWQAKENRLTINKKAKVILFSEIGSIIE